MAKPDQTSDDQAAQLRRFQEAARDLECDDDAERFDERLKRLAKAPKGGELEKPK